jgi:competence protein ComEC
MPKHLKKSPLILKNRYFLILVLVVIGFLIFCFNHQTKKIVRVSYLDIGQGDAALIRTPAGKNILIDGGPDNLILHRLGERLPFYVRRLDYLIISHFHDDHITGLIEVLKRYQVDKIILSPSEISSPAVSVLLEEIKKMNIPIINIKNNGRLQLDEACFLFFVNPDSLNIEKNENNSLVTKLDCQNNKFLFAGDNEAEAEAALIKSNFDLRSEIFKASHHGSKTSNTATFLEAIRPQKMIISVGTDNRFGHPNQEVLERAIKMGIKLKRTDIKGTIDILAEIK